MEHLSHAFGPLWSEFKSLNYSNPQVDQHSQLLSELQSFHEICKDHFQVSFQIPKCNFSCPASLDFIPNEFGLDLISKEISHFRSQIETLSIILLLPAPKALHRIQTLYLNKPRNLLVVSSKGFSSSLNLYKVEAFLLERYEKNK